MGMVVHTRDKACLVSTTPAPCNLHPATLPNTNGTGPSTGSGTGGRAPCNLHPATCNLQLSPTHGPAPVNTSGNHRASSHIPHLLHPKRPYPFRRSDPEAADIIHIFNDSLKRRSAADKGMAFVPAIQVPQIRFHQ